MYNSYYMSQYPSQMGAGGQIPQQVQVVRVNGRNGADAYRLAPNSSALLLDENDPLVWLKTTDGAGYATVAPYTITPYHPVPAVDVNGLESRVKRLEDILNGKSDDAANTANGGRTPHAE